MSDGCTPSLPSLSMEGGFAGSLKRTTARDQGRFLEECGGWICTHWYVRPDTGVKPGRCIFAGTPTEGVRSSVHLLCSLASSLGNRGPWHPFETGPAVQCGDKHLLTSITTCGVSGRQLDTG